MRRGARPLAGMRASASPSPMTRFKLNAAAQEVVLDVGGCRQDMDQLLAQMRLLRIGSKNCARTMWDFS